MPLILPLNFRQVRLLARYSGFVMIINYHEPKTKLNTEKIFEPITLAGKINTPIKLLEGRDQFSRARAFLMLFLCL